MRRNLTRQERLRRSRDIKGLFAASKGIESRGLKLLYKNNGGPATRFAVVVARGCGGAVRRNREKRITREAYRSLKEFLVPGNDLLFLITRFGAQYSERRSLMEQLLGRAGLRSRAD
ncbi:MAG: ribonuclease P protein component [Spirochaetia bacterium]